MNKLKLLDLWLVYSIVLSIPIIFLGFFSFAVFPAADDVNDMARLNYYIAGNIFDVFMVAIRSAFSGRSNGTFSHYILRGLGPGYISLTLNRIIIFIFYWLYISAVYLFIRALSKYFLGLDKNKILAVAVTVVFLSLNHMLFPAQSLFWYSGVVNYMFILSCYLFLICNCMDLFFKIKINKINLIIRHIISFVIIFIIAGSQTAGGILLLGTLFFMCLFYTLYAMRNKFELNKLFMYAYFLFAAFFLLLNIRGSIGRREMFDTAMSPPNAVIHAGLNAASDLFWWHHGITILLLIIFLPTLITAVRKFRKIEFNHPLVVTVVLVALFVAMYVPAFFGMGSRGPERLIDFYRNISYLFVFIWFAYIVGFLTMRKLIPDFIEKSKYIISACAILLFLVFGTGHLMDVAYGNFYLAARQFNNGQISQYRWVMNSRELIFNNDAADIIELAPFPHEQLIVFDADVMDLTADAGHWRSIARARLHDLEWVRTAEDLGNRIFRVIAAPLTNALNAAESDLTSRYITTAFFVRDYLVDVVGYLPIASENVPTPHANVYLVLISQESNERLFYPVFPLARDIANAYEREVIRNTQFTTSLYFRGFADGLYTLGIVLPTWYGLQIIPQGELVKHGARIVWHPFPTSGEARVPVLMYHHIDAHIANDWVVSAESFALHMRTLRNFGFNPVTSRDMADFVEHGVPLPPRPIMITFDDGYLSMYEHALPILMRYGMTATNFVIGHTVGTDTYKDTGHPTIPKFDFDHMRAMAGVVDIQSHSYDMHQTPFLEEGRARQFMLRWDDESTEDFRTVLTHDVQTFNEMIRSQLDEDVIAIGFPHGRYDDLTHQILRELGIRVTFGTRHGINTLVQGNADSLFGLYRINITDDMDADRLLDLLR